MQNIKNSLITATSIVIASFILAFGLSKIITPERSVTVRGLSEKEVDADLAIWNLKFSIGENDLSLLQKEILNKTKTVTEYLNKCGLSTEDYIINPASIVDNSLNLYMDQTKIRYTFIATQSLLIRSSKIQQVKNAYAKSFDLVSKGITINREYDANVIYEFTKLNEVKPLMIAEATKNARLAAEQFARDSNSNVGKIKKATQGLFSIENAAPGFEEKKNVRVVTTVEYLLK